MANISIEIRYSDRPAEVREFNQPKVTIGRESGNIVLGDPSCSGRHAEINVTGTHVTYVDLNSTNGSFAADGRRLTAPTSLTPGSEIRIGGCTLVLQTFEGGGKQQRLGPQGTHIMEQVPEEGGPASPARDPAIAPIPMTPAGVQPSHAPAASMAFADTVKPTGVQSPFPAGAPARPHAPSASSGQPGVPGAVPPPPYGAVPPEPPPHYGAPPPTGPGQPGVPSGANPYAAPIVAGAVASNGAADPGAFISSAIETYKPHFLEATKVLGIIALPLGLMNAASSFIPIVGFVLSLIGGIGFQLIVGLVGFGAVAEFALRLNAGVPITAAQAWKIQLRRAVPFFLGILVPFIIAGIGSFFCFVPGILLGFFALPVYMIERDKKSVDINKRSFELVTKEVMMVAVVIGIAVGLALASGMVALVLGQLPYIGESMAALWGPIFSAILAPFMSFLAFRLYFAARRRHEGVDAIATAKGQFEPV